MQGHGIARGVGLTTAGEVQTILVSFFFHPYVLNHQLRRIHIGVLGSIRDTFPTAVFEFLPIINQIQARNLNRQTRFARFTGIDIGYLRRSRSRRMNGNVYLKVNHTSLIGKETYIIYGRYARSGNHLGRSGLGIRPGDDFVLGCPGEAVYLLTFYFQLNGGTRTNRGVAGNLGDFGNREDMDTHLRRIHRILGRTGITHRYLAMNTTAIGGNALVFGRTVETGIQGIVHIPTVHAYLAGIGIVLNPQFESVGGIGAIIGIAHQHRLAQHAFIDGNPNRSKQRIHAVGYPYLIIGNAHRTYQTKYRGIGRGKSRIGGSGVLRQGRPGKIVNTRSTPRSYRQTNRIAFASRDVGNARIELTALEADDMAVFSHTTMGIGCLKGICYRNLNRRGESLELIGGTFYLIDGSPGIGQGLVFTGLHAGADNLTAQGVAGIVLYDNGTVRTRVNLRILEGRHHHDRRRFGVQGRTLITGGDQCLNQGTVFAQVFGQGVSHALAHLLAHTVHQPIHGVVGVQLILGGERERYRRTFADGVLRPCYRAVGRLQGIDVQAGYAIEFFGIVGIKRITPLSLVGNPAHTAAVLVIVHAQVELAYGGVHAVFLRQADIQYRREVACPHFGIRIRLRQILDRAPDTVALIHLPIERKFRTRSANFEHCLRTVANRSRLRMVQHTHIGIDFYPNGVFHLAKPRFGKRNLVSGARARPGGYQRTRAGIERSARRPNIFSFFAATAHFQIYRFAQIDFLGAGNIQNRQVFYREFDGIRNLGTAIHAMDARNQQQADTVAVL